MRLAAIGLGCRGRCRHRARVLIRSLDKLRWTTGACRRTSQRWLACASPSRRSYGRELDRLGDVDRVECFLAQAYAMGGKDERCPSKREASLLRGRITFLNGVRSSGGESHVPIKSHQALETRPGSVGGAVRAVRSVAALRR